VSTPARAQPKGRQTLGVALIAIGLVLTLDQAGLLDTQGLGRWWPLFLIGIGYVKFRQPLEDGQRALGAGLLFLGGAFQLLSILAMGSAWPLLMVGIGVFLLWRAAEPARPPVPPADSPFVSEMVLIGHLKRKHQATALRGGYVTAVLGGVELDLRNVRLANGSAHLDVFAFWGGIEVKVPPGWTVDAQVVPIMGAVDNKTQPAPAGSGETLVLRGHVVMGAIVVGN
jgi:hypothetical protein